MKHFHYFIFMLLALACQREIPLPETAKETDLTTYVNVGVRLVGTTESKSVVSTEVENFHKALLFAFDPSTGNILKYGSNAGTLEGKQIVKNTSASSFSWPLPMGTAMRIYCIINPPGNVISAASAGAYSQESRLSNAYFTCSNVSALSTLESSDTGLPKAGILEVTAEEFTEENSSLSISVKNLFAKFGFSVDLGSISEDAGFKILKVKVFGANTSVPYFVENYRQTSADKLKDFDYATEAEMEKLSKGGSQNDIVLYALENCQGTRSGAASWSSVREDQQSGWSDINLCTRLLVEYELDSKVYVKEIFLGAGDMKTDFNVKRNMYKSIVLKPGEEISATAPYFSFADDIIYSHPGEVFTSASGAFSTNLNSLGSYSLQILKADGTSAGSSFSGITYSGGVNGVLGFTVSPYATLGEYMIKGGISDEFYWSTFGTTVAGVTDKVKLLITEDVTFTPLRVTDTDDIYPYTPIVYESQELYTLAKANALLESIQFASLPDNIDNNHTSVIVTETSGGYKIQLTIFPIKAGDMGGFTVKYGSEGKSYTSSGETVLAPELVVFNGSTGIESIHVDVYGNTITTNWALCKSGTNTLLSEPSFGNLDFSISKKDALGTEFTFNTSAGAYNTTNNVQTFLAGFDNLQGFELDNYCFSGASLELIGTYTYPSGYSISKTINAFIDNPLASYSYDGKTYEYEVHQGRTGQGDYVSASSSSYHPENMLTWPARQFNVDLSRGASRGCNGLEVWTQYSGVESVSNFTNKASLPRYIVIFNEDFNKWGPIYYGKRISNSRSHEALHFIHSIIRIYNHYNVFAGFDVQEKRTGTPDWDDLGNYNWSWKLLTYYLGGFKTYMADNFHLGSMGTQLSALLSNSINNTNRVKPILSNYNLLTDGNVSQHGDLSSGSHDNYQVYHRYKNYYDWTYVMGYYEPSNQGYYIYYDWVYVSIDGSYTPIYWRSIASNNTPWFKIEGGNITLGGMYVSSVSKTGIGEYNCSIVPSGSKALLSKYKDSQGRGYQFIHPFWEGKEGRFRIASQLLHPSTSFSADLCIVNGWYDPTPYASGIPILKNKVGMYFFPESTSAVTRAGYPAYYSNDAPYSLNDERDNMEIGLEYGTLKQRDTDAGR